MATYLAQRFLPSLITNISQIGVAETYNIKLRRILGGFIKILLQEVRFSGKFSTFYDFAFA